jgi:hypothetical protein
MDSSTHHTINNLFEQLGLDSKDEDIETFIAEKKPIRPDLNLPDAEFWTKSQSTFLKEIWQEDAVWVEAMDELSARLRG